MLVTRPSNTIKEESQFGPFILLNYYTFLVSSHQFSSYPSEFAGLARPDKCRSDDARPDDCGGIWSAFVGGQKGRRVLHSGARSVRIGKLKS